MSARGVGFDPHALTIWLPASTRLAAASPWRRWLAQGDRQAAMPADALHRLASLFDVQARGLPVAALLRQTMAGDAGEAVWLCADPAWARVDPNGVRLMACGRLGLAADEADELTAALAPLFAEHGMALHASAPEHWQLRLPPDLSVPTFVAPEQAMGADLFEYLPSGQPGRAWRRLLNETQVLLHQHPRNAQRQAHGLPPVNTLWFWGAGRLPANWRSACLGALSDDELVRALLHHAGRPTHAALADALPTLRPGWLLDLSELSAASLDALVERLTPLRRWPWRLLTADGVDVALEPWHRLRFWRRSRDVAR